jgi:hypothetical protein
MRLDLETTEGIDNLCPMTTGIFLRELVENRDREIPSWRIIDEYDPLLRK